jgi:hypothetical protein
MPTSSLTRAHRSRLMQIWRSAGWPCQDAIELDLLAAGLLERRPDGEGRETLRLSDSGIAWLAEARLRNARPASTHDRLALRFAEEVLMRQAGRLVWRELSLRAQVDDEGAALPPQPSAPLLDADNEMPARMPRVWRMARPDLYSVRHSSVESYLQPQVHEVKASRADLLSDLRHAAKRQAYEWLCSECYYVFPEGVAKPNEIPEQFGVWVLRGSVADGEFELLRPARHQPCRLPFAVWMALAKATPLRSELPAELDEPLQASLGQVPPDSTPPDSAAAA